MQHTMERVIGIDLGTGGLRALVVDLDGLVEASAEVGLGAAGAPDREGWHEQDALTWRHALERAVGEVLAALPSRHLVRALACCATSGTVLAVDRGGRPAGPALLYNDTRAAGMAGACSEALGEPVGWSFGLPKMVWMAAHSTLGGEEARFVHAVDFLNEGLVGEAVPTDFTSALKSGWSPATRSWPAAIFARLGLERAQVPAVVPPGRVLGTLRRDLAERWGLSPQVSVVAGATDANAAFYASGASRTGEWNSALGSTLAVRGVAARALRDPEARLYNHLHPDGGWLVSGASNVGTTGVAWAVDAVVGEGRATPARAPRGGHAPALAGLPMAGQTASGLPEALCYPLAGRGERLPFVSPHATAMWTARPHGVEEAGRAARFSVALVERWIYDLAASLGAPQVERVYATGGTARDDEWLRVRAGILGCPVVRARRPDSVFGSAIIAAASLQRVSLGEASARMCHIDRIVEPDAELGRWGREALSRLQEALRAQDWWRSPGCGRA